MVLSRHSPADAAKARLSDAVSPRTGTGGQPNAEACGSGGGEHFRFAGKPSIQVQKPWQKPWQKQGLVNVPFWEYWTSPEKVAIIDIYRPYT